MSAKFKNGITIDGGNINTASGQVYKIDGTTVLSSTQVLGKGFSTTAGDIVTIDGSQALSGKTSYNKVAITAPANSATLTIADGKTLTANNSIQLSGTDSTTMTFPSTSATIARTDAGQTFTGTQTVQAASTQDSVKIAGRNGGSSSYGVTITPTTLSDNRTLTLANGDTTLVAGTMAPTASPTFTGSVTAGTSLKINGSTSGSMTIYNLNAVVGGDYTVYLPASNNGTLISSVDSGTVTSGMIADATIVNGDISTTANIVPTKTQIAGVALSPSASQTVPTGSSSVATDLAFDTVTNYGSYSGIIAGTAGTYSSGTHTAGGKITATVACWVQVSAGIIWSNATTGTRVILIRRYSSSSVLTEQFAFQIPAGAAFAHTAGSVTMNMTAGQYIVLAGYQTSGGVLGYSSGLNNANLKVTVLGVV